ncbi:hypothetical protein ACFLVS_05390 [Chloroflexota bacterium]
MTIREFAEATGCSKNLAFRLARQNKLPVETIYIGEKNVRQPAVCFSFAGRRKAESYE